MTTTVTFRGGTNIAMKVPPHLYESTVAFYRDVLGLPMVEHVEADVFEFGHNRLWIDSVAGISQAEIWLEVVADDLAAAQALESPGVVRRDEIEPLPPGLRGFWISSPASIIHLVRDDADSLA